MPKFAACILFLSEQHILLSLSTFALDIDPDVEMGLMKIFSFLWLVQIFKIQLPNHNQFLYLIFEWDIVFR